MRLSGLWWWIDRWRKSTAYMDMTLEQQGAYRNLLDEAALRGGAIPNDENVLAKACGDARVWRRLRAVVMSRFDLRPDGWHNETMDAVLAESQRRRDKQRDYRNRSGNEPYNTSGNGTSNKLDNAVRPLSDETRDKSLEPQRKEKDVRENVLAADDVKERAARFTERYAELFRIHRRGARYVGKPTLDYQEAITLCANWDSERLEKLAIAFLTTDEKFCRQGSGSIAQFRSRASWCDDKLREKGL